jgi:hypothetical protein
MAETPGSPAPEKDGADAPHLGLQRLGHEPPTVPWTAVLSIWPRPSSGGTHPVITAGRIEIGDGRSDRSGRRVICRRAGFDCHPTCRSGERAVDEMFRASRTLHPSLKDAAMRRQSRGRGGTLLFEG